MPDAAPTGRWMLLGIVFALLVWGTVLGIGAALELPREGATDWRKLGVVLASSGLFLAFWGAALWVRSWRQRRSKETQATGERDRLAGRND